MQEQFKAVFREQNLKSAGLEEELRKAHAERLMSENIGPKILMMFIGKRMRENLPCARDRASWAARPRSGTPEGCRYGQTAR